MSSEEELTYNEELHLPPLYKDNRVWKVWVYGSTKFVSYGVVNGKMITKDRGIAGKRNRSGSEQAQFEANKDWVKKTDAGYRPKCKEGKAMLNRVMEEKKKSGGHNINAAAAAGRTTKKTLKKVSDYKIDEVEKHIIPMKAQSWVCEKNDPTLAKPKVLKYFDFDKGVYTQWKLDGFRCIIRMQDDKVVMTSNSGKQFPWFGSLREEVKKFLNGKEYLDALDCELYAHTLIDDNSVEIPDDERFKTISSMCGMRMSKPHKYEDQICLYVFDLVDMSGKLNQDERFKIMKKLFKKSPHKRIIRVKTETVYRIDDISTKHGEYAQQGYEGLMIRARNLTYKIGKRSLLIRKFKHFFDAEFVVTDIKLDPGVDEHNFVWECETSDGEKFYPKPCGTMGERQYYYDNYLSYIGMRLTVKYQELSPEGIPRFPIAKGFRESGDI